MSIHSAREWRTYILTRGVFGNALKFAHRQTTGEITRTPYSRVCRLPVRARPVYPPDSAGIAVPAAQATALRAIATKNGGETYFRYANFGKHLVESLPYKGEVKIFGNEFL